MSTRILIIGAPELRRPQLEDALQQAGYQALSMAPAVELAAVVTDLAPALIIFSVRDPQDADFAHCCALLARVKIPLIVLFEGAREDGVARALEAGATEALVWPIWLPELLARLRAILRRTQRA